MYWYKRKEPQPIRWMDESTRSEIENLTLDEKEDDILEKFGRHCDELSYISSQAYNMDKPAKDFYNTFIGMIENMKSMTKEIIKLKEIKEQNEKEKIKFQKA